MLDATSFLQCLYGDDALGYLVLWTRQDKHAYWLPAGDVEAARRLATQLAPIQDVYFGVALQDKEATFAQWRKEHPTELGEPTTRGYSETAKVLPGFWTDIDVRSLAHKATNLPPTKAAARVFLTEFPLPPTLVIDSGHGLQPWWLFRELWVFESDEERLQAQALAQRFLATLQEKARVHGWHIDPTADLARILRLPGTWNRKVQPVPVRVIELNETCRYNPSDFEPYLVNALQTEDATARQWHGPAGVLAPVLEHCRFLQHCQDHAALLSEPEWYAMVSNVARLEGGREAIHEFSAPYPRYSRTETNQKIAHVLRAAGPHTCQYIQQSLGFPSCPPGGCGVRAPAALGLSRHDKRAARVARLRKKAEETARRILAKQRGEVTA